MGNYILVKLSFKVRIRLSMRFTVRVRLRVRLVHMTIGISWSRWSYIV